MTPPVPTKYPVTLDGVTEKLAGEMRARGLVLLNPDDDADVEKLAEAMAGAQTGQPWGYSWEQSWFRDEARAVLDALAGK